MKACKFVPTFTLELPDKNIYDIEIFVKQSNSLSFTFSDFENSGYLYMVITQFLRSFVAKGLETYRMDFQDPSFYKF